MAYNLLSGPCGERVPNISEVREPTPKLTTPSKMYLRGRSTHVPRKKLLNLPLHLQGFLLQAWLSHFLHLHVGTPPISSDATPPNLSRRRPLTPPLQLRHLPSSLPTVLTSMASPLQESSPHLGQGQTVAWPCSFSPHPESSDEALQGVLHLGSLRNQVHSRVNQ